EERTHPLTKDRVAIGRSPDCDIVLKGISVARYHAQLVRDGSHYLVEDLQSSNGTYVNGYQIRGRVPLKDNDRIHLGGTILVYRRAIAPRLAAPPLDQNVQFSVYRPNHIRPQEWYTMLAFAHLAERPPNAPANQPDPVDEVRRQACQLLGAKTSEYQK